MYQHVHQLSAKQMCRPVSSKLSSKSTESTIFKHKFQLLTTTLLFVSMLELKDFECEFLSDYAKGSQWNDLKKQGFNPLTWELIGADTRLVTADGKLEKLQDRSFYILGTNV